MRNLYSFVVLSLQSLVVSITQSSMECISVACWSPYMYIYIYIYCKGLAACAADPGILRKAGAEKREERREKREEREERREKREERREKREERREKREERREKRDERREKRRQNPVNDIQHTMLTTKS